MEKNLGLNEIKDSDKMSKWFLRFSVQTVGSNMYQFLSKKIANDAELLSLAETADQSQPVPNLLLAAVNFLLYKNPSYPLSKYYPNHSGRPFVEDGLFENFKEFCLCNSHQLTALMKTKLVQTNEVRRCALLFPALAEVAKVNNSEIALIDIGTSSGLNLLLDKYFYNYSDGSTYGNSNSELTISCELKNNSLGKVAHPKVSRRIGVDLNPIDLSNPDEMLWTISLVWPDQTERIERLKSAIALLKNNPVDLLKGNGSELLKLIVKDIPNNQVICVMHSFTLNQFSPEARQNFEKTLSDLSNKRDVWRISLEWLGTKDPELSLDHYSLGKLIQRVRLATCHQHGEWMNWYGLTAEQ